MRVAVLGLLVATSASAGPWTNINPGGGGAFTAIGAGPTGILICASDLSGAYRSLDQGLTWEPVGFNGGIRRSHVCAIGFDPADPQIVHLGTEVGLYRSADGGVNFTRRIDTGYVGAVAHAASDPAIVYAAYHPAFDSAATAIYRSADRGLTWAPVSSGLPAGLRILKLAVSPGDPNTLVAISGKDIFLDGLPHLFRSSDGGVSWGRIGETMGDLWDVALDPLSQGTMYATSYQGTPPTSWSGWTWKSTDGGDNWTPLAAHTGALHVRRDQPQVVRVIDVRRTATDTLSGVWETLDGGLAWSRKSSMAGWSSGWQALDWAYGGCAYGTAKALGSDLARPDAIYWVSWQFPFGSADGGLTFQNLATNEIQPGQWRSRGIDNVTVAAVEPSEADPARIYVGLHDLGLWRSGDGGASWQNGNHVALTGSWKGNGGNTISILADPLRAGVVWATLGARTDSLKLARNTQAGLATAWAAVSGVPTGFVRGLALDRSGPADPRRMFVTANGDVYRSVDDGLTWTMVLDCDSCRTTAVERFDGRFVFAGGEGGLWRSQSYGDPGSWTRIGPAELAGPNTRKLEDERWDGVHRILSDPHRPGWLYVAAHGAGRGLYRTTDRGNTWTRVLAATYLRDVAVDPLNSQVLYAAASRAFKSAATITGSEGLQRSIDGGATWTSLNDGLAYPFAVRIAVDPGNPQRVILGAAGNGFFERFVASVPVGVDPGGGAPEVSLSGAHPNPARGEVTFTMSLPQAARIEWSIHDLQGRRLWGEARSCSAGTTTLAFDPARAAGPRPGAGIYFARLAVDGRVLTRRFALLR